MGQGRTLERAKDNRRLSASARTTGKNTCRTGSEEKPQREVRSPTIRRKGRSTHDYQRARPTNTWPIWWLHPEGQGQHEATAQRERKNTLHLRSDRGQTSRDPITVGVKRRWEENPPELTEPEQSGGQMTGKKPMKPLIQQTIGRTTTGTASQHTWDVKLSSRVDQENSANWQRTVTSQGKAWPLATRSSDKPKEDVRRRQLYPKKGGYIGQNTTNNVNLRSWSRVTKRHYGPKGWPHPGGIHRRESHQY